jgi:hypothetical protein
MREVLHELWTTYQAADRPPGPVHDWQARARSTLDDLARSPKAHVTEYGDLYALPYVAGQYPDSMVQIALVSAIEAYARARGQSEPLAAALRPGIERFYDPEVGALRRYLPSVGEEKDYHAVDSWYLYHPMMHLARLAALGDDGARGLLLKIADYGVRAARHFSYAWPVFYDIRDFSVIRQQEDDDRPGETDTGGLYAYAMLQLHELTGEPRYLAEARAALEAADGHGLELMYQANLTAWGAAACLRLWRISGERAWLDRAHYWLANLLVHCRLVESRAGFAVHYPTVMAVPCMYNSTYAAPFEDLDCFEAFGECLVLGGEDLDPAAAGLLRAFRRHALERGGFFYPDQLPAEIIARAQESGEIHRALSFPLEDLYPNGEAPGRIGQEIYGCGLALAYATQAGETG